MQKAVHHPVRRHRALNDCRQMVSGSISLRSPRFFSPFPHGTGSLSIQKQYLALEGGPPIFSQGFTCPDLLEQSIISFRLRDFHPLRSSIPANSTNTLRILGLFQFRSPLLSESRLISFPQGTEMFHFPWFALYKYSNIYRYMLGCPIRIFMYQCFLTAPHDFSQSSTSFFASSSLGIHHLPLVKFYFI